MPSKDNVTSGLKCELEGICIVLLGSFNPAIFQPAWLAAHGLIRQEESDAAKLDIIHADVASFSTDWLQMQITKERFSALTNNTARYVSLRDLVIGIFSLLEHTPLTRLGINRQMHYRMLSTERWHAFGHFLAPKEHWKAVMDQPGLLSLTLLGKPLEQAAGQLYVRVEPSVKVKPGVYFEVTLEHAAEGPEATRKLMTALQDSWHQALERSKITAEHLLGQSY